MAALLAMSVEQKSEIDIFIQEIRAKFPEVSKFMNSMLERQGYNLEDKAHAVEMEAFSQATNDAINAGNLSLAKSYLSYVSRKLNIASPKETEYIDVYYVESLLWDVQDSRIKKRGWSIIPENLKALYVDMWGEPAFL